MWKINWKKFEIKNPKATEAFETLCYFLFCRKFNITEGIRTDFNQVGLETEPVKDENGKYWGFQSKYFDKQTDYANIESSIKKALDNYPHLNYIIIYLNQAARTSCKNGEKIENLCKAAGVQVEWFLPNNFLVSLNQVKNQDLAEFYFGETDAIRVLSDSKDIRLNTLLQSKEYILLKLQKQTKSIKISDYSNEIMKSAYKLHLFSGAAGSGKSTINNQLQTAFLILGVRNGRELALKLAERISGIRLTLDFSPAMRSFVACVLLIILCVDSHLDMKRQQIRTRSNANVELIARVRVRIRGRNMPLLYGT